MKCNKIIAIRLMQRTASAPAVQETLTRFGCNIKMRLGLHDVGEDYCSNEGLVLLQVCGKNEELSHLLDALNELKGVKAKMLDLDD